jgi:hypothetical protein
MAFWEESLPPALNNELTLNPIKFLFPDDSEIIISLTNGAIVLTLRLSDDEVYVFPATGPLPHNCILIGHCSAEMDAIGSFNIIRFAHTASLYPEFLLTVLYPNLPELMDLIDDSDDLQPLSGDLDDLPPPLILSDPWDPRDLPVGHTHDDIDAWFGTTFHNNLN